MVNTTKPNHREEDDLRGDGTAGEYYLELEGRRLPYRLIVARTILKDVRRKLAREMFGFLFGAKGSPGIDNVVLRLTATGHNDYSSCDPLYR